MSSKVTQNKRLERAKQQYESLLINAGEIGIVEKSDYSSRPTASSTSVIHGNAYDGGSSYNSSVIAPSNSYLSSSSILSGDKWNRFPLRNPSNMVANTQRLLSSTNNYDASHNTFDSSDFQFNNRSSRGISFYF
jgi:hypothetical protein